MRKSGTSGRDDTQVGGDLERLVEDLERHNGALAGRLRALIKDHAVFQRTLADLEHERARIEQARREWTTALDAIQDPIFIHDKEFRVVRANRAYAARAGVDVHEVAGKPYWTLFPKLDGPLPGCREALDAQRDVEEALQLPNGEEFVCRSYPVRDGEGNYLYSLHLMRDVTAKRRAEAEQRILSEALRQAAEAVVVLDRDLRITYVNPAFRRVLGYALEEIVGQPLSILSVPGLSDPLQPAEVARRVHESGRWQGEVWRRAKDGTAIPALLSAAAIRDASGGISGYVGAYLDLRDIKHAQEMLQKSEQKYRSLVETTSDFIWEVDEHSVYTYASPQVRNLLGYEPEEIVGRAPFDLMPPAEAERIREQFESIVESGQPFRLLENVNLHKSGRTVVLETSGTPLFDRTGAYKGYRGIDRDITERKRAEESLRSANRALKTLSACNVAMMHAEKEDRLLADMCRAIVETGGYRFAWVGYVEHDAAKTVRPAVHAGFEEGYLEPLQVTWDDVPHGHGPVGRAVRSGRPETVRDVRTDPGFAPWRAPALERGYAAVLALPLHEDDEVLAVLAIYAAEPGAFDEAETKLLTELADDLTFGILTLRTREQRDRAIEAEQHSLDRLRESLEATIGAVAATVEMRDPYTAGHERRVAQLASAIASEMGLSQGRIEGIHFGSLIHDLGKIKVPAEILSKPTALTKAEFELVKEHAQAGYDILKGIQFPWPVAEMALQHHEHMDGSGYPSGLKGDEMLLESRILAVADTVEAMSSHRPYRPARGVEAALAEIERHRGDWYDPAAVDACLRLFAEKRFAFSE